MSIFFKLGIDINQFNRNTEQGSLRQILFHVSLKNTKSLYTKRAITVCIYHRFQRTATKATRFFVFIVALLEMEKRLLTRRRKWRDPRHATVALSLSLFCGNFSHSDPLRTITKWLAENVRNIIGGALLVAVFVAEARPWNEISRSAKNQCWFGGKFRGNVVLRRPNLANERSLPKRD